MGMVVHPFARRGNPLAGSDYGGVAENGNQFAVATGLDAKDTKAVFGIVESYAFDKASQNFLGRRFCLMPRLTAHEVPSSVAVNNSLMVENCAARFAIVVGLPRSRSSSSFVSCVARSTRAMCVRISCGVNISLTWETNRGSSRAN
jgi:hypothetical protein